MASDLRERAILSGTEQVVVDDITAADWPHPVRSEPSAGDRRTMMRIAS
jgi:hypothetical protein